jgi:hypothetical protein
VACSSAKSSILTGPPFGTREKRPIGDSTRAHLITSSASQHTLYVYGVYKYCHSPLAPEGQKQEIREIMHDI